MNEQASNENRDLIEFWDRFFEVSQEEKEELMNSGLESLEALAPSEKLLSAAYGLGTRKNVLDFGCGNGWAAIAAAKSGCPSVTAADAAKNAFEAAGLCAKLLGADERVHPVLADNGWLKSVPDNTYDGLFCSNVLDVVPPETAEEILREAARIVTDDAEIIIGLNKWMSDEAAAEKDLALTGDKKLFIDGVLRLVSRTDEEWKEILSRSFSVEGLEYFAWHGEPEEKRRLFLLRKLKTE